MQYLDSWIQLVWSCAKLLNAVDFSSHSLWGFLTLLFMLAPGRQVNHWRLVPTEGKSLTTNKCSLTHSRHSMSHCVRLCVSAHKCFVYHSVIYFSIYHPSHRKCVLVEIIMYFRSHLLSCKPAVSYLKIPTCNNTAFSFLFKGLHSPFGLFYLFLGGNLAST